MGSGSVAVAVAAAAAAAASTPQPTGQPATISRTADRLELITSMANGGPGLAHNQTA